jgi:heavy metal sensor kinase
VIGFPRPRHVRTRLTLWYVAVLSGVLALYALSTLIILYVSLRHDLDRSLRAEYERVEELLEEGPDHSVQSRTRDLEREAGSLLEVWSTEGTLLYRSEALGAMSLGGPPSAAGALAAPDTFVSLVLPDGTRWRVLGERHNIARRAALLRVALSERPWREELQELGLGLLFGLPVAATIAGLGGHWLARRTLAPLGRMAGHAERMTAETLGERIAVDNPDDELGHLARAFNASFARIETSFDHLRRFTADVSHELRTPLTAIRSLGEVRLGSEPKQEEYRETISSILEEADRLALIVDSLLSLSRADSGQVRLDLESVDLMALAREVVAHLDVLAEERDQSLLVEGEGATFVRADRTVLRQALVNVVDNAIKYSPRAAPIRVVVSATSTTAQVAVIDRGPGIPLEYRQKVFERFYRLDSGRSRAEGGAGLGLSLARWAVSAHGGRIELGEDNQPGSTFCISLAREVADPQPVTSATVLEM